MIEELTPDISAPLIIGAKGMDAIRQNIKIILLTMAYSIPLDRGFAHAGKFIDAPNPLASAKLISDLTDAIEKYEPRVKVISIEWKNTATSADLQNGIMRPVVKFTLKKGVKL